MGDVPEAEAGDPRAAPSVSRPHRVASTAGRVADEIVGARRLVLACLALAQVLATAVLGSAATHNGWAWFQGGDQMWYATDGWLLGGLHLPPGLVAYGWPLVLTPLTWITGPTWLQAMPPLAALNVLVLGPAAMLCVYAVACRLAGRLIGLFAALLWVVAPYAVIPLWIDRYHERWVDQFLPQALGLTALADFPSMVALLVAAWLLLRAVDARSWTDAAAAGLVVGYAGAIKPPNLLFLFGAALAWLVSRRWREAAVFAAALAPGVLTLMLWKERTLGSIPLFALPEARQAVPGAGDVVGLSTDRYVDLDWGHWQEQMSELHEFFQAPVLVQLAPFAGIAALALVRRWTGLGLLVGWLGAFLVVKGTAPQAGIELGSFFRLLMPAWPAYLLLVASIPLLVPALARRRGPRLDPPPPSTPLRPRWLVIVAVALALVPLAVVATAAPIDGPERAVLQEQENLTTLLTPVDDSIQLRLRRDRGSVVLSWDVDHAWRGNVTYVVLRSTGPGPDVSCVRAGATNCTLTADRIGETRLQGFVDKAPPAAATYRVGVAIDYRDRPGGDIFAVSRPVAAP